jgi:hypothetical protein
MITPKELNEITTARRAVPGTGHSAPKAPAMKPGRHRTDGTGSPTSLRVRALLDRRGLCQAAADPGSWFVVRPDRTVLEREAARVRARVLCAGCPVRLLCRRTVLAALTRPAVPGSQPMIGHGAWGGLAWREIRAAVRRARKGRARATIRASRRQKGAGPRLHFAAVAA